METLVLQERRRRELPPPVPLRPRRPELLEETIFDEPDSAFYDRFCTGSGEPPQATAAANADSAPDAVPHLPPESDHV